MARVRAALEADAIDKHEEDELRHDNDDEISGEIRQRSSLHEVVDWAEDPAFIPSRIDGKSALRGEEKRSRLLVPFSKITTSSILRQFEQLLYTSELEEELLQRDIFINRLDGDNFLSTVIISETNEGNWLRTPIIPTERQDKINEHATIGCKDKDTRLKLLTKNGALQYDEIVATLAESVLERILEDIAEEIEEAIVGVTGNIVCNL
ncbi:hypothetical protein ACHAXA_009369 [Cyclostephanos tholiformis]|uniref:Uncharacterized protein n=1 Tax=Cyclostephanos tholiformis TaxID=382380 RepID=A0ABD3SQ82_9STRA